MRTALFALLLVFLLGATEASAQTTPTFGEKAVGSTDCKNGAFAADFDTLAQCTSTSSTTGTMQKAPIFVGAVTSPPYPSTTCDSNKAGMIQYTASAMQYCNGTAWQTISAGGSDGVPAGAIFAWPIETVPSGYLECDGSAVSRTTYAALFAVLSTTYGAGDGSTTFNLPDFRGEFLRGWDHGRGVDPDAASRTMRGDGTTGDNVGTLQGYQIQSHSHTVPTKSTAGSGGFTRQQAENVTASTNPAGGNETRPRNVNVMYIIKY